MSARRGLVLGPFDPAHLVAIGGDVAEIGARPLIATADPASLGPPELSRTVFLAGQPVAAGGFVDMDHGVALVWGAVGVLPSAAALALTRLVRKRISRARYRWIEAQVTAGFDQSLRWMGLLGFVPVNGERCAGPDGTEFIRFVFRGKR